MAGCLAGRNSGWLADWLACGEVERWQACWMVTAEDFAAVILPTSAIPFLFLLVLDVVVVEEDVLLLTVVVELDDGAELGDVLGLAAFDRATWAASW